RTPQNFPLLRYSDVLLMFAEADFQVNGGPTAEAVEAVNQVRRRAWSTGIKSVNITDGGSGYTSAPTVIFNGGEGTKAVGRAIVNDGVVTGVNFMADAVVGLTNGTGYTSEPEVISWEVREQVRQQLRVFIKRKKQIWQAM